MYRIAFGGIGSSVLFADVILADVLTSYSRIFGDIGLVYMDLVYEPVNNVHSELRVQGESGGGGGGFGGSHQHSTKNGGGIASGLSMIEILVPFFVR